MPNFPDSLPDIIFWRMACCTDALRSSGAKHHKKCKKPTPEKRNTLWSLPRKSLQSISSSGVTNAPIVKHYIPDGADAWRLSPDEDWKPMSNFPEEWKQYLERK